MLPSEKCEYQPNHKCLKWQWFPCENARAMVAQSLLEQLTNVWSDLRPIPQDAIYTWYCVGDQESETNWPRDLELNQILLKDRERERVCTRWQLTPNNPLHSQTSALLGHHQRRFLLQQMETFNTETTARHHAEWQRREAWVCDELKLCHLLSSSVWFIQLQCVSFVLSYYESGWEGRGEELGRVEAGETRRYYGRKKLFPIKISQTNNLMMHLRALVEEAAAKFQISSKLKLYTTNVVWQLNDVKYAKQSTKSTAVTNNSTSIESSAYIKFQLKTKVISFCRRMNICSVRLTPPVLIIY